MLLHPLETPHWSSLLLVTAEHNRYVLRHQQTLYKNGINKSPY